MPYENMRCCDAISFWSTKWVFFCVQQIINFHVKQQSFFDLQAETKTKAQLRRIPIAKYWIEKCEEKIILSNGFVIWWCKDAVTDFNQCWFRKWLAV